MRECEYANTTEQQQQQQQQQQPPTTLPPRILILRLPLPWHRTMALQWEV
jgi:hypothetical protein